MNFQNTFRNFTPVGSCKAIFSTNLIALKKSRGGSDSGGETENFYFHHSSEKSAVEIGERRETRRPGNSYGTRLISQCGVISSGRGIRSTCPGNNEQRTAHVDVDISFDAQDRWNVRVEEPLLSSIKTKNFHPSIRVPFCSHSRRDRARRVSSVVLPSSVVPSEKNAVARNRPRRREYFASDRGQLDSFDVVRAKCALSDETSRRLMPGGQVRDDETEDKGTWPAHVFHRSTVATSIWPRRPVCAHLRPPTRIRSRERKAQPNAKSPVFHGQ